MKENSSKSHSGTVLYRTASKEEGWDGISDFMYHISPSPRIKIIQIFQELDSVSSCSLAVELALFISESIPVFMSYNILINHMRYPRQLVCLVLESYQTFTSSHYPFFSIQMHFIPCFNFTHKSDLEQVLPHVHTSTSCGFLSYLHVFCMLFALVSYLYSLSWRLEPLCNTLSRLQKISVLLQVKLSSVDLSPTLFLYNFYSRNSLNTRISFLLQVILTQMCGISNSLFLY